MATIRTRADAQQRFATQNDGATIITDHIQAWLLTAVSLMKMARPEPDFRLPQPYGPALEIMATSLLDTLQGIIPLEMRMGIAAGNTGEVQSMQTVWSSLGPSTSEFHPTPVPLTCWTLTKSRPESRAYWRLFHLFSSFESHSFLGHVRINTYTRSIHDPTLTTHQVTPVPFDRPFLATRDTHLHTSDT